ncbi:MAG: SRPBCC family protein [Pseudomonadota bacterium]
MKFLMWIFCALPCAISAPAGAVDIEHLSVTRSQRTFETHAVFIVDAPRDIVVDLATDFERLEHINPAVVATEVQRLGHGEIRVTTTLRDCAPVTCRTVVLVEDVLRGADDRLTAKIVPYLGDFAAGGSSWEFESLAGRTRVHYRGQIRPAFFVPPLFGAVAFKRALRRQIRATAHQLEALGRARELSFVRSARQGCPAKLNATGALEAC